MRVIGIQRNTTNKKQFPNTRSISINGCQYCIQDNCNAFCWIRGSRDIYNFVPKYFQFSRGKFCHNPCTIQNALPKIRLQRLTVLFDERKEFKTRTFNKISKHIIQWIFYRCRSLKIIFTITWCSSFNTHLYTTQHP